MYKDKYLKYKNKYLDLKNSKKNIQKGGYTLKYNVGDQVYINGKIMTTTDLHNPTQWNTKEIMANNIIGYIMSIYKAETMEYSVYTIKLTDELYIPEILEDKISIEPYNVYAAASLEPPRGPRGPTGPTGPNEPTKLSYCSKTMMLKYKFNKVYREIVMNKTIHKCKHILPNIQQYYNSNMVADGFLLSNGRVEFGLYKDYVYYLCAVNNISDFELLTIKNAVDIVIEELRNGEYLNNNNQNDVYINTLITQFNQINPSFNNNTYPINNNNTYPIYYSNNNNSNNNSSNKFVNSLLTQKNNLDKLSEEEDFDEYLKKLRKLMTKFYYKETLKWLEKDKAFLEFQKIKNKITSDLIKEILKDFININKDKKNEVFWHELNSDELYDDVKDHIKIKIAKLISKKVSKKTSKK